MASRDAYTIYVSDYSPYSIKALAILGWAGLDVSVKKSNLVTRERVLKKMTGKTMVPMLRKGSWAINDSTRIARFAIERSARPILPKDPSHDPERTAGLIALAWLLEEFADEWVARWFIHERWHIKENREALSKWVGRELVVGMPFISAKVGNMAASTVARQTAKAGAGPMNSGALGNTRDRTLDALEAILLQGHGFLFGGHPTMADFGFYGPLEQYRRDPAGASRMSRYPAVCGWLMRMRRAEVPQAFPEEIALEPAAEDAPRPLSQLRPLLEEFGATYWRVLVENHAVASRAERAERAEVTLGDGVRFAFTPSGYGIKRLGEVLSLLDAIYNHAPELLEEFGELQDTLKEGFSDLSRASAGRELLTHFPSLPTR